MLLPYTLGGQSVDHEYRQKEEEVWAQRAKSESKVHEMVVEKRAFNEVAKKTGLSVGMVAAMVKHHQVTLKTKKIS
jgi:hypothetical protein